ncbi:hypothetical protein SMD20_03410 [Nonomuraea sp. LP-02]|uniref:hypothetical protein n=1 Tax=Nonomuraea sp. LP-02 TaxID=3097960 RepID=UPI002E333F19|nr:hypothetical protein [Nonomuraea sp. LP-02]MED7923264.1 hypothetical protein [Nonomuraea sp. LP-02]
MSNGARHALGVVAGLLLPPLTLDGLLYGVGEISFQTRSANPSLTFDALRHGVGEISFPAYSAYQFPWYAVGALAATAVVLAFLAGSRLSPVASLLGGLWYTAFGLAPLLEFMDGPRLLPHGLLPARVYEGYVILGYSGALLVVGVMLLTVSLFPSRWRAAAPKPLAVSPAYGQGSSPYLPEDATRPMYRE